MKANAAVTRPLHGTSQQDTSPAVRFPIRAKITLPYLLLAIILAIGAAFVVLQIVFDTVDERFTNQLIESGKLASGWMVTQENRQLESLRLLANTEGVAAALVEKDAKKLRGLTFGITVSNQEEAVEFLDTQGNLVLSMRHKAGGNVEEYSFVQQGPPSFRQLPFVEKVLEGITDPQGDKFAGLVRADWGDYFYVAGPIQDPNGELVGAVLVGKSAASLARQIREATVAQVTIYDFSGQPIASTFMSPQPLPAQKVPDILLRKSGQSLERPLDKRDLQVSDLDYSEIIGAWEARDGLDLGLMGVALAKTFLVNTSSHTRMEITALVAAVLLLVVLLGINLSNRITAPLLRLVQATHEVSRGNLQVQVEANTNDEVAVLAGTFNQMISTLYASQTELLAAYDSTLEGWSRALELRDKETEGHTRRVTDLTLLLARRMNFPDLEIVHMRRGALLHDIGKMGIPDQILLKPGPLSPVEWVEMRRHPEYAYKMLYPIPFLRPALDIPYCHHEKWDGSGYPRGLKGEAIPLAARIFAIIDVWDAMISDRPYRKALPVREVVQYITSSRGTHFDPNVVDNFLLEVGRSGRYGQSSREGKS